MHLLYFWLRDYYQQDLKSRWDHFHLNQNSHRMRDALPGRHLWAFTRNKAGHYVLAADLVVSQSVHNPPGSRYGKYRVYGDQQLSRYFAVEGAPSAERIVRLMLNVRTNALGQSFQGPGAVRAISEDDHQELVRFARDLRLEPLIHGPLRQPGEYMIPKPPPLLLGEGDFDVPLIPAGVVDLPTPSMSPERRAYLMRRIYERDRTLVDRLQDMYSGRCQLCEWEPKTRYGHRVCDGHHIQWLSQGGTDALDNMMLVCPNHHRAIHATTAQLDFKGMEMVFQSHREPLRLNEHLPVVL